MKNKDKDMASISFFNSKGKETQINSRSLSEEIKLYTLAAAEKMRASLSHNDLIESFLLGLKDIVLKSESLYFDTNSNFQIAEWVQIWLSIKDDISGNQKAKAEILANTIEVIRRKLNDDFIHFSRRYKEEELVYTSEYNHLWVLVDTINNNNAPEEFLLTFSLQLTKDWSTNQEEEMLSIFRKDVLLTLATVFEERFQEIVLIQYWETYKDQIEWLLEKK